ncbi:phosphonate ABC transporter, permease protein PhnE [Salinicoccus halitifaciens]|uniref:Phosphonate transport system permease protein n=1 Tax=Salinicoccus halitifaciens TaxID=1073415 RepID=A0ABV2E6M3_9STAP|nr:phosphonate ABC transporter, permease protein PhnE [Salinicoccus halitifaciens]MCD2136869.1 phosphonate ABC transporter, permease protein PhnE [Salinicoccus halitifaciens]
MSPTPPKRFEKPSIWSFILILVVLLFLVTGINNANITLSRVIGGVMNIGDFLAQAFPPDFSRIGPIMSAMVETFEMALVGTLAGVIISIPVALLSSRTTNSISFLRSLTRGAVTVMRTVPDLVWALLFVIAVGLGPFAGILTITIDTIGFCARFFSERIDELDKKPKEALESTGSGYFGVITGSVLPQATPSFVGTSLFALEKSIRGATVLGLVGAGGIGVELSAQMSLRNFDQALMIIIIILILVLVVENISQRIRAKYI